MNSAFDRNIKQELENASPEMLGYRPDRDKLWDKIAEKKKKKTIPFTLWISHAAAVAAGLVIGIFFLMKEKTEQPALVSKQPSAIIQKVTDTIYVHNNTNDQPSAPKHSIRSEEKKQLANYPSPIIKQDQDQEEISVAQTDADRKEQPQHIVVKASSPVRVLHLVDMNNENADPKGTPKEGFAFFKKFANQSLPDIDNKETLSMIVSKHVLSSKDKNLPQ